MSHVTVLFDPLLPVRFETLRAFVAHRSTVVKKSLKKQAEDMGMSPSTLSRKMNPLGEDTQRVNLDDLEAWLASTGDAQAVVEWLAAKFLVNDGARRERLVQRIESTLEELSDLRLALKESGE